MDVKEAILKRRAYRAFEPVEITIEILKELAEAAQLTPSCMNNQPWRYVFIKEKDQLQNMMEALMPNNVIWGKKASLIIGVFSKPKNDCIIKERIYYLFDTGMATAFIILRATELGLVAHPIAGFNEEKAKKIMNIPDEMRLITLLICGKKSDQVPSDFLDYMKTQETERPARKPIEELIFYEKM